MEPRRNVVASISHSSVLSTSPTQSPSHLKPTPSSRTRRNEHSSWPCHRQAIKTSQLFLFIFLTCCLSLSSATVYIDEEMVETPDVADASELLKTSLDRLHRSGKLLVDQRPPPNRKAWTPATEHDDLRRRDDPFGNQDASQESSSSALSSSMITTAPSATQTSASGSKGTGTSSSALAVATTTTAVSLPVPFDQGFSGNITDSCNDFMNGMLTNATFKACLPFSLLLQSSNSFFQASKSITRITQTLDATCAANLTSCSKLMTSFASNITSSSNCASDLSTQNPLIQQARLGLLAYKPLYTASCLRNPSTSSYCYADAVTNASSPTDTYIYYLPLNISLPGGSQPTCSQCLKDTMAVFEASSADRTSALASDYVNAAMQVNVNCGPTFVNQSLAAPIANSGSYTSSPGIIGSNMGVVALVMVVASWLI